jgi:tetratricopeptide (TPR) repeat protein
MTRDRIHRLVGGNPFIELDDIERLHKLDGRLKTCTDTLTDYSFLAKCRQTYSARPSAWWWNLQSVNSPLMRSSRFGWAWGLGTLVCLLGSATFIMQTAKAFSTQGFDAVGTLGTLAQGTGLALVAGGAATERGRKQFDRIMVSLNIPGHRTAEASFALSVGLLAVSYGVNANLDRLGDYYLAQAQRQVEASKLSQAIKSYERAYQFGASNDVLLEQGKLQGYLGDYEAAIATYKRGSPEDVRFTLAQAYTMLLQALDANGWETPLPEENLKAVKGMLTRTRNVSKNESSTPHLGNTTNAKKSDPLEAERGLISALIEASRIQLSTLKSNENILDKPSSKALFDVSIHLKNSVSNAFLGNYPFMFDEFEQEFASGVAGKDVLTDVKQIRSLCLNYSLQYYFPFQRRAATVHDGQLIPLSEALLSRLYEEYSYYCPEQFERQDKRFLGLNLASIPLAISFPDPSNDDQAETEVSEPILSLEEVRQKVQLRLQGLDASPVEDGEPSIVILEVDDRGYVRDYTIHKSLQIGSYSDLFWGYPPGHTNLRVLNLWREDFQKPKASDSNDYRLQAEFLPDGTVAVYPWGNVYTPLNAIADVTAIDGFEVKYPKEIDIDRRNALKGELNIHLGRLTFDDDRYNEPEFFSESDPLEYRLTVALDGAIMAIEPLDDRAREAQDRTVLSLVNTISKTNLATTTFVLRIKSFNVFLLFDT